MTPPSDLVSALTPVVDALERLGIAYQVGGSVASSAHGAARSTMDVDLVARMEERHVRPFVEALGDTYYVDEGMVREAIRLRSSFNLIHQPTMYKVDVFIPEARAYDAQALQRGRPGRLSDEPEARAFRVATPEDVILAKLEWYERGGRVSDRQWHDILGVMRVQADLLDVAYLRRWAQELAVGHLLERALAEARGGA